jgi:hypothetical protein
MTVVLAGCVPVGHERHIILGFGIFTVSQTNQVKVTEAKAIGVYSGGGQLNVGASKCTVTSIPTNSNTVLEIHR